MIDALCERLEVLQCVWFTDVGDLVLDAIWKSAVEGVPESVVVPLDLSREPIEGNHVFRYLLVFLHDESFELGLGCSDGVRGSEVGPKFMCESVVVGEECQRRDIRIGGLEIIRLKPI